MIENDEVRIEIKASALNFFDLLMLVGKYQMKPPLPFVAVFYIIYRSSIGK